MARNEEDSIRPALTSLLRQSIFDELRARREVGEVTVLANGCTDRTLEVAREVFARAEREHPHAPAVRGRAIEIPEPGRNGTWNRFVHELSAREARFIFLMDADIVFHQRSTILDMVRALERDPYAWVSSDRPCKDLELKKHKRWRDRISLQTSDMTGTIEGRMSGQLYGIRAEIVRNVYLPRDLIANEDGFIKAVVCTDFLTRPRDPARITVAPGAAHLYEAYVSPRDVLKNQKRQMIGQTAVHVLLEHLEKLPREDRVNLASTLRALDRRDPDWLRKLLDERVRRTRFFWQIFPGASTFRLRRLWKLEGIRKLTHLPAAAIGSGVTMLSCWSAFRSLKEGQIHYWPKATRQTILEMRHDPSGSTP